ncbi:NUDIX domain-containing protein [Roseixanthobacter glucoisosaccharinicivorans]|uniref:NUDIX domain-containing protein n=1 Tax=Roseixanthobacter glucoisosaccharinicivorans TaxID=3119923 RepID=UPI003726F420
MLPLLPLIRRVRHGLTLGVRTIVMDEARGVLLVRHSYTPGWHFPGGGVDVGETTEDAARRELMEEAAVTAEGPLVLHGLFFNPRVGGRDHVACYLVPRFSFEALPGPNLEIREVRFFPRDALPEDVTASTLRRLAEIEGGQPPDPRW